MNLHFARACRKLSGLALAGWLLLGAGAGWTQPGLAAETQSASAHPPDVAQPISNLAYRRIAFSETLSSSYAPGAVGRVADSKSAMQPDAILRHRQAATPTRPLPAMLAVVQPERAGEPAAAAAPVPLVRQFAYSYLLAYMFFLSLCLGGLFFVLLHHLFDASWSVTIRRFMEHMAFLLPVMAVLFLPIAILAPHIYPWMNLDPAHADHALRAKHAYLNRGAFCLRAVLYFVIWSWLSFKLRYWSLAQDKTGAAQCTFKMRKFSYIGIFLFAITVTGAAIDWVKSISHEWYSTMYGVYFFASCAWTTAATVYVITMLLERTGRLRGLVTSTMYYYIGSVLLAFTVFYAYIHFAQYFIIWNANVPEETFWYVLRERGTWWDVGMVIVFGHFLVPFLALLRIDVKLKFWWMVSLGVWAWLMNFADLSFNIMPALHPDNFVLHWLDLVCLAFIGGVLVKVFLKYLTAHPAYPLKDPRLKEALTHHEVRPSEAAMHGGIVE